MMHLPAREARAEQEPGPAVELSNSCSCPSRGQADPPAADHPARAARRARGQENKGEAQQQVPGHCLMGTVTSCLPQELLDPVFQGKNVWETLQISTSDTAW